MTTPATAAHAERHDVAPALTVRFADSGLVASSLIARPGSATGALAVGDGVFQSADPDYPPLQMWVPLDGLRLELLRRLAERAPCDLDGLIDEVIDQRGTQPTDRAQLDRFVEQLRAGGLIAPAESNDWSRPRVKRADQIPWERAASLEGPPAFEPEDGLPLRRTEYCAYLVTPRGFERLDADGGLRDLLTATDILVLNAVDHGRNAEQVYEQVVADPWTDLARDEFDERLRALADRGLVVTMHPEAAEKVASAFQSRADSYRQAEAAIRRTVRKERRRSERTGIKRPIVLAIDADQNPLLALGTLIAYSAAFDRGRLKKSYSFAPILYTTPRRLTKLVRHLADWPVIVLFSDYIWTRDANLAMSAMLKEHLPGVLTIHGGPEMPKYTPDAEDFFRKNPGVDLGVRGEGEATLAAVLQALIPAIPLWSETNQLPDLSLLADVEGVTYRDGDRLVETPDRERIADLDTIPSPYLTGLFDDVARRESNSVTLESNRGCPYGCTFCDWGSSTLTRIRKFSLDRVKAEMEWAAERGIADIGLADANFGILERDVELAQWAVDLKERYGAPTSFAVTYAKSRVQNLTRIVRLLAEADIVTQAAVSVQTFDSEVLQIVRRKNLDLDQHMPLVEEIDELGLPIYTDVMIGLPGSRPDTVRADLQMCIDREIHYRPNPTQLLVNSPMNDEEYKREHGIVARTGEYLIEAGSYTREDMRTMMDTADYLLMADRRGTLRELATYTRSETRLPETEFYRTLIESGLDNRRWPFLGYVNTVVAREFIPPGSWAPVIDEIGDLMVELGVPDDDALAAVLAVQRALIPMSGRSFPESLHLPHDYVAWHASVRRARQRVAEGRWVDEVEPLRTFGPGVLDIRDGSNSCGTVIGVRPRGSWSDIEWELETPIARSVQRVQHAVPAL